jgi:hypothetical protein
LAAPQSGQLNDTAIASPSAPQKTAQDRGRTIADSTRESSDSGKGAAKSAAKIAAIDPELADLVANWPSLPVIIKSAILAVARQHLPKE